MKHLDYAKKLNRLSDTYRYPTVVRINKESVAEHSYHTAMLVLLLSEEYAFNVALALPMALVHDVTEIDITDVPHPVKHRFPQIRDALYTAELELSRELPISVKRPFQFLALDVDDEDNVEQMIVHFADALSCLIYSDSEVKLGNSYMQRVYDESVIRIQQFEERLSKWKR